MFQPLFDMISVRKYVFDLDWNLQNIAYARETISFWTFCGSYKSYSFTLLIQASAVLDVEACQSKHLLTFVVSGEKNVIIIDTCSWWLQENL